MLSVMHISCCTKLSAAQLKSIILSVSSRQSHLRLRFISTATLSCLIQEPEQVEVARTNHGFVSLSNHPNPEISCFLQKGFSQITEETTGKALHAICVKGFLNLSVFHSNTLINMYSKFGYIDHARNLFDKMPERNDATWNNMMTGFVRLGLYEECFGFFVETLRFGFRPSGVFIASLVTACDRSGLMVNEGFKVHGFAVKIGLLYDVFVGTSLLHFYGRYGFASNSRSLFEEMPNKNVVSWTSLMVAYLDNGNPIEVANIYMQMRHVDMSCNENTLATLISSCGLIGNTCLGYQVLAHVIKFGLENTISVPNSLISMFGSFGSLDKCQLIFDSMRKRDVISWNSIISARVRGGLCDQSLRLFHMMRRDHGEMINSTTLSTLLSVCGSVDNLKWGRSIHGLVVKLGLDFDVCVCNTLLSMYAEAGKSEEAEVVFGIMPERDLISWNSLIACYVQDDKRLNALEIFSYILKKQRIVNYVSFTSALAACSDMEFVAQGKIVHAFVVLTGLQDNLIVGNALITMYGKMGMMIEAKRVFQTMKNRDEVTWNALIGGYAENEESNGAVEAYKLMREESMKVNYITFSNVLGACLTPDELLKHGMPIHGNIVSMGFESNKYIQNSLITMYAKCGDLNSSSYIFNGISEKNSITWNAMISSNAHHGQGEEIIKLIRKMRCSGVDLDQFSFSEGLSATAKLAVLEEGQQIHGLAVKLGFDSDHFVINAAMDMYSKCGEMDDVLRIIPVPINRSRLSWNILISAFARHGYFFKAKETFEEMVKYVKPDHVTFVSLLSACSHGGLVEDGLSYYNAMTKEFDVSSAIEHCVCIVDLLGRSGRLKEAEAFINEMQVRPNDLVWRALLSSCKLHRNLELARKAAEHLLEWDPSDDSVYVLYSNVCALTGRWEDLADVRRKMGLNHVKKKPACSWVKLKNGVCSFGMGDQSHPQTNQIYAKLDELRRMIKEAGYVPDTSYALQDTDEEQKEHNLWNHSERLALAYGLMNTPEGSSVRIFKNLRICGDCHLVFKFISKIISRKIILRDAYRFHHFLDGECSCCDYW